MDEKINFKKFNTVENCMLNIVAEGEAEVLASIEAIADPINRFGARQVFYLAKERLAK